MIDHITFTVSDFEKSKTFYVELLKTLGYTLLMEFPNVAGFGEKKPEFWIGAARPGYWTADHGTGRSPMHVAFSAEDRKAVDAFYEAAVRVGGKDYGKPGVREIYHPDYYGAFVIDPDGNNVEAVCHKPT